jgi:tetratricopeptide (TPR) repeat protein
VLVEALSVVRVIMIVTAAILVVVLLNRRGREIEEVERILQKLIDGALKAPSDRFRIPPADSIAAGWQSDALPGLRTALVLQEEGRDREAILQVIATHDHRMPCRPHVYLHMHAGNGLANLDFFDEAQEQFNEALLAARDGDFTWGVGAALLDLSLLADGRPDPDEGEAQRYAEQALEAFRLLPDGPNGGTLTHLGNLAMHRREWEVAERHYRDALDIFNRIGSEGGQGCALGGIGSSYLERGDLSNARDHLDRALSILKRVGDRAELARTAARLGELNEKAGDASAAEECFLEARSLFAETGLDGGVEWVDEHLSPRDA